MPIWSFLIFCNRIYVNKAQRVPPFTFFGTMRHLPKEKNFRKFQVFSKKSLLRFLSLRYSADFRRSRLVNSSKMIIECQLLINNNTQTLELRFDQNFMDFKTLFRGHVITKHYCLSFIDIALKFILFHPSINFLYGSIQSSKIK